MADQRGSIVYRAGKFVTRLLIEALPPNRVFHNLHHTLNVVQGAIIIGGQEGLAHEELEVLILAAWFHDSGHVEAYEGHEASSQIIALRFLRDECYPEVRIDCVLRCIEATTMPQEPRDAMEAVLCDADLFHLSFAEYDHYQELLREEWKRVLGVQFSDADWERENNAFLATHRYFTDYGQMVLEPRKAHPDLPSTAEHLLSEGPPT